MSALVSILPSLLAGDFGHLEDSALKAQQAGGDALHLDIMDGRFVPNLSMGPEVVRMARKTLTIPLNVHLMLMRPDYLVQAFVDAGADTILIHVESQCDVRQTLRQIRELGVRPGVALNPETPAAAAWPYLDEVEEILCMTVHPGFGGQRFMPEVLPKITELRRAWQDRRQSGRGGGRACALAVDGGIDLKTVTAVAAAGANRLIVGSALFQARDMTADVAALRAKAAAAFRQKWKS